MHRLDFATIWVELKCDLIFSLSCSLGFHTLLIHKTKLSRTVSRMYL